MLKFPTFNDLPLNSSNADTNRLLEAIADGKLSENILLIEKNGVGKSLLAQHLPTWYFQSHGIVFGPIRTIDCPNELDVPGLKTLSSTVAWNSPLVDWIVLDEVDKATLPNALNQWHGVLEMNDAKKFILTANELAKLPQGIQSRCQALVIEAPSPSDFLPYAQRQLQLAGVNKTDDQVLKALTASAISGADCRSYMRAIKQL